MVLIALKGEDYSTVSDETAKAFLEEFKVKALAGDPSTICQWLFNSKEIQVRWHIDYADDPTPPDEVYNYYHRGGAGKHPYPENFVTEDEEGVLEIRNPFIQGDPQNDRWRDGSNNPSNHLFYAFIHHDKWYWMPGIVGDPSNLPHPDKIEISDLSMKSYKQTVKHHDSEGDISYTLTITTTITKTYYQ